MDKKKSKTPHQPDRDPKKMNRAERVKIAKRWSESLTTKKKIKAYAQHFGLDKRCTAKELTMAGVELSEKHAHRWATSHERKASARKRRQRAKPEALTDLSDSDETFYYIAGYTAGGFAYGMTWDEAEERDLLAEG